MDVRNRMADVVKLRCNACQDFLRMILKEGWQQKLYDKAHYEVSNNTRYKDKYIATYEHMRDSENAIANFSVDDMDVTLITELVVTHFVGIESVERATCNALKELRDNRNLTNHSNENEDADELYFSRFYGLSGSGFPAPNRPFFIRRFLGISNIVVCSVMEHTTLLDFSFVILPPENRADKFFLPHDRYFLRSTIEPLSSVFTYVQESRFSSGFFRIPNPFRFTEVRLCR